MKSKVILIIEDNEKNLRLVHDILESQGYRVIQARSGKEGIETAREQRPDLIIMDIQMPGIDGITATRILKQDERTCNIPVIALTAMAMKGDRDRILQAGCDGYLPKPVRFDALLEAVENGFKPDKD
ncbi:response regulator [Desulfallas sp. Bu1-1]|jgi:two-component system cell cycle response regulator DivK|uniref:response regulator n=1 Tax=Desulfallas sp. Bu1-1 TaxID=2787620 RepID=UPI0018A014B0|nr:response regulator [Desulfallas sp. Bu1-1]MBF7082564.1 response regulator [Desulfallas sp. Bu1-1]